MRGGGLRRLGDCVAVAFEDLFGGDVCGGSVEEGGIVEDRLEVFGDLWNKVSKVSERKKKRVRIIYLAHLVVVFKEGVDGFNG